MIIKTLSEIGKRTVNQDYILIKRLDAGQQLFLLADGMGGYSDGEVAAKLVSEIIYQELSRASKIGLEEIQIAIRKANESIRQISKVKQVKMGTTIAGLVINKNKAIGFWVGDVKILHFQNKLLKFESESHSLYNEVLKNGSFGNKERAAKFKHVVTRSIQGDTDKSEVELEEIDDLSEDDIFILSSDGIHDNVPSIKVQQIIKSSMNNEDVLNKIESICASNSKDNYSLILIEK